MFAKIQGQILNLQSIAHVSGLRHGLMIEGEDESGFGFDVLLSNGEWFSFRWLKDEQKLASQTLANLHLLLSAPELDKV